MVYAQLNTACWPEWLLTETRVFLPQNVERAQHSARLHPVSPVMEITTPRSYHARSVVHVQRYVVRVIPRTRHKGRRCAGRDVARHAAFTFLQQLESF